MKDPKISMCQPATRGIWVDILCGMHENNRSGTLSGTREQLARLARCSIADFDAAKKDLETTKAADVTERNGIVTLKNRRMLRDFEERKSNNARQKRYRDGKRNGNVTAMSPPPLRPCNANVTATRARFDVESLLDFKNNNNNSGGDGENNKKEKRDDVTAKRKHVRNLIKTIVPSSTPISYELAGQLEHHLDTGGQQKFLEIIQELQRSNKSITLPEFNRAVKRRQNLADKKEAEIQVATERQRLINKAKKIGCSHSRQVTFEKWLRGKGLRKHILEFDQHGFDSEEIMALFGAYLDKSYR